MINIEILDDTIDPAGLQRQVATQIESIKSMIATVSENDDQYRELYIAIWTVPQCISHIKWGASFRGRRLYTAPCGIWDKWLSGRRTPLYLNTWTLLKNHFRSRSLRHKAQCRQPWSNKSSFLSLRWIKFWFFRLSKTHRCSLWRRVHYWSWLTSCYFIWITVWNMSVIKYRMKNHLLLLVFRSLSASDLWLPITYWSI